jgi:peptidoglycan/xylan/chitin deacetylase (PgdA/CDA1 family)
MAFIAKRFKPLSVEVMHEHLNKKKAFPSKSILITFDDGWKDNYAYARAVLKEKKIPAIIFLSTGFIGQQKSFWQEHMARLLWAAADQVEFKKNKLKEIQNLFNNARVRLIIEAESLQRHQFISELIQHVKSYEYSEISAIMHRLEEMLNSRSSFGTSSRSGEYEFLSWDEVQEMFHEGIDFGSHGVNHLILDKEDVDIDFELKQSKSDIEDRLGGSVLAFSYPNGNYSPMIAEKVRSTGYALSFSTEFGYNDLTSNRFALKRINVHQDAGSTVPLFTGRMLGLW